MAVTRRDFDYGFRALDERVELLKIFMGWHVDNTVERTHAKFEKGRSQMMGAHQRTRFPMGFRTSSPAFSILALLLFSSTLTAQKSATPTLGEVLDRLEANLNRFDSRVPSLFCDEHIVASVVQPKMRDQNAVIDSIFRLRRTPAPDHTDRLVESREIKTVDGERAKSQDINLPTLISGAFEGGLDVVPRNQSACMSYKLQRLHRDHATEPYVIRLSTSLTPKNSARCLLNENSKGRVFIDPASLRITHLELITPRHVIIPGTTFRPPVIGKRVVSIDYAPVLLGGETFWMPSTIDMQNVSGAGTFHMMAWSYRATYRNYHLLEVTSRILPGSIAPVH